jgi:hypothetical protein
MDQQEEKPNVNACLMDAISASDYAEWREHPSTNLLLKQLNEDIRVIRDAICNAAKFSKDPDVRLIACYGTHLSRTECVVAMMLERSDG